MTPEASPITAFRLTLDADQVYWGATEIHPEDARAGDVVLDHQPDNAPGKYRWDRDSGALHPLPVSQQKDAPGAPDLESTLDALLEWLSDGGEIALPARLAEWRAWYQKTIDRKKSID